MPRKRKQPTDIWIVESSIARKAKEFFLSGLQNFSTLLVEGGPGTGKSKWIEFGHIELNLAPLKWVSASTNSIETLLGSALEKTFVIHDWKLSKITEKNCILLTQYLQKEKYDPSKKSKIILEISETEKKQLLEGEKGKLLYQEISLLKILIPDLKERKSEIPIFISQFSKEYCEKFHRKIPEWEPDILELLQKRPYQNHLKELKDVVVSCLSFNKKNKIKWKEIPNHFWKPQTLDLEIDPGHDWEFYEKAIIKANLAYCKGNREKTAQILNISVRNLYRKIEDYEIDVDSLTI